MKLFGILCVFLVMLTGIGCVKKEETAQTPLSNAIDAITENNNSIIFSSISITLTANETKGITDITEFFRDYLKDKSDEYISNVETIIFHQDNSAEEKLEHLGDLKMFPNLRYLRVSSNLISVDTDGLPSTLETLVLSNNKIVSFNAVSLPQKLGVLRLDKNNLSSFYVEVFPDLVVLDLSRNNLSSIDVASLPQTLQHLHLSQNNISSVDAASLPKSLNFLDLMYNPIEDYFYIAGVDVKIYNNPNGPVEVPREEIDFKQIFRDSIYFPDDYSEEEKEKVVENMVESYLSSLRHHEAVYGTLDTQELMESIARFLE
jgi:hypothetical protein